MKARELIQSFLPRIKYIVKSIKHDNLPPIVDENDLYQMAVLGLYDAIERYDESKGSFVTYANIRVRGYILDQLRKLDYIPRSRRNGKKALDECIEKVEMELSRKASLEDIANYMGVDVDKLNKIRESVDHGQMVSLNQTIDDEESISLLDTIKDERTPEMYVEEKQLKEILMEAINSLNERERLVITLYYYEDLNMAEIGKILGCTESRVSQIHTQVMKKIRERIKVTSDERRATSK
jgi:RNA polymerase sigma factor for flagellar operon FliA